MLCCKNYNICRETCSSNLNWKNWRKKTLITRRRNNDISIDLCGWENLQRLTLPNKYNAPDYSSHETDLNAYWMSTRTKKNTIYMKKLYFSPNLHLIMIDNYGLPDKLDFLFAKHHDLPGFLSIIVNYSNN